MSDPRITDEAVEVATRSLHPGLFEDDGLLHPALAVSGQWQARHKVRAALEAALPYLAPRPVVDREALAKALHDAACGCDHYGHLVEIDDRDAADVVLALIGGGAK